MEIITKTLDKFINLAPNQYIFDIETTGLSPKFSKVILIGIVYNEGNNTVITQFFAHNVSEEEELLLAFIDVVKNFDSHITFNGVSFDIPFLNYRLNKHNIDFSLSKDVDIDILRCIKPFKERLSISDCKLKTVEKYLDIHRCDTISGKESVDMYKDFEETGDISLRDKILLHNYDDIYYLGVIFDRIDLIENKLNPLYVDFNGCRTSLILKSFKFDKDILKVEFVTFNGVMPCVDIYEDYYSLVTSSNVLHINITTNIGYDSNKNKVVYFNASKIIPLQVNGVSIDKNISMLCNLLIKKWC